MLNLYILPSILILAKLALCQSVESQPEGLKPYDPDAHYSLYRPDDDYNYRVWIRENRLGSGGQIDEIEHYIDPDGRSEDIPIAAPPLVITLKFKSKFDNFRYKIICPNRWYWPEDAPKGSGAFHIATAKFENTGHDTDIEHVDPSTVCLYEDRIHDDGPPVEAKDSSGKSRRMCCMDNPLKGVPGADLNAVKLAPESVIEYMFNEPSWVEPVKEDKDQSSNTPFNGEKTATEPNTAPEPRNGIDLEAQVTPNIVTQGKDTDFRPQNGATDAEYDEWTNYLSNYNTKLKTRNVKTINKRKSNNRFQKR